MSVRRRRVWRCDQFRDQFVTEQDRLPGAIDHDNRDMRHLTAIRLASAGNIGKEWSSNLCHLAVAPPVSGPELASRVSTLTL